MRKKNKRKERKWGVMKELRKIPDYTTIEEELFILFVATAAFCFMWSSLICA